MPNATYQQAVALKALGMPQDVWPQLVWVYTNSWDLDWWTSAVGWHHSRWLAAPNVIDATLWVLGSEAWEVKYGERGLAQTAGGRCWLFQAGRAVTESWRGFGADSPSELLDAVLEAVKEAS